MPHYQFSEKHRLLTQASPAALMDAVLQPGVSDSYSGTVIVIWDSDI